MNLQLLRLGRYFLELSLFVVIELTTNTLLGQVCKNKQ